MRSTSSLPSLPGPLWPGVIGPDRVLSMDQIELNWTARNRTACCHGVSQNRRDQMEATLFFFTQNGYAF